MSTLRFAGAPLFAVAACLVLGCKREEVVVAPVRPPVTDSVTPPRTTEGLTSKPMVTDPPVREIPAAEEKELDAPAAPQKPAEQPVEKPAASAQSASANPSANPPVTGATPVQADAKPADDEVKHWVEYWEGTKTPKFKYEMRKSANGRWARNGYSQAFYASGVLEREGQYKDNQRVGKWKYYKDDGSFLREEDRGAGERAEAPSKS